MGKIKAQIHRSRLLFGFLFLILLSPVSLYLAKNASKARADNTVSFNEGTGTSVHDSFTSTTGTITNAVWKTATDCFEGKCLYFNGSDSFVSFGDEPKFDFAAATSFTIEIWFRMGPSTSTRTLVAKHNSATGTDGGYKITASSDGNLTFAITDDNTSYPEDSVSTTTGIYADNAWHHLAAVKISTTKIELYLDGVKIAEDTSLATTSTLENTDTFYLGIDGDGTSNPYQGYLDQLKVYRSARTRDEIIVDMVGLTSDRGGAAVFGDQTNTKLVDGLIGYWRFNESSGDTTDDSGLNQTLTNGNTTPYSTGYFGNAANFTPASAHYFSLADNPNLSLTQKFTLSAWIKPDAVVSSTQYDITGKWDNANETYLLAQYGDEVRLYLDSSANYIETTAANLAAGNWYHLTATYDGSNNQAFIYINGTNQNTTTTGSIPSTLGDDAGSFIIGAEDTAAGTTTLDRQIAAGTDDAHQNNQGTSFDRTDIEIRVESGNTNGQRYNGGFRYQNITIPQGTTITAAYWQISANANDKDGMDATIYAEDVDDSADFATTASVTGRTTTTASTNWTQYDVGSSGTYSNSPSITAVIQEVIDRAGWSSGNDLTILAKGNQNASPRVLNLYSYESSYPTRTPILHIEYSGGAGNAVNVFDGLIDEVRVYNRALPADQVSHLASYTPSPQLYYTFNQGSSTTLMDDSSNNHSGILNGSMQESNYARGKFGKGLLFDGSNDNVSVATTVAGVRTLSFWINPSSTTQSILALNGSAYLTISGGTLTPTGFTSPTIYVNGVVSSSLVANVWQHVSLTTATPIAASAITLGLANSGYFSGILDEVKLYNYVRPIAGIISDMNGEHPAPGSPVGSALIHYRLDEGRGSLANNSGSGGSATNGTITNGAWTTSGKLAKAYQFDATTSITTTITDPTYINSLTLWVYPTTSAASKTLITTGKLTTNASSQPVYGNCTGTTLPLNTWTHLVAISENSGSCKLYQNGTLTAASTTGVSFGTSVNIGGSSFTGLIDEVKLYSLSLTESGVLAEYNQGKSTVFGATSTESDGTTASFATTRAYCVPGDTSTCDSPISEWRFEEKDGTTTYDTSGNNHSGSFVNTPRWTKGKVGNAIHFDGINSYIAVADHASLDFTTNFTISAWVKPETVTSQWQNIFVKGPDANTTPARNYSFYLNYDEFYVSWYNGGWRGISTTDANLTTDTWYHITYSRDTSREYIYINGQKVYDAAFSSAMIANNDEFQIGERYFVAAGGDTDPYKGDLDELQFFNYVRTPAQIALSYNRGKPLARYRLDECSGTTIHDMSGNNYDGTLTIGATGTNTAAGSCSSGTPTESWNNGTTGKLNSAISLDGTDDFITIGDLSASINTVAFWVKPTSTTQSILELNGSQSISASNGTITATGFSSPLMYVNGKISSTLAANVWQHIAVTTTTPITASAVSLGKVSTSYFSGLIDDLCIYNYVITPTQITTLMTQAAVSF